MTLTPEHTQHIANLARLALTPAELTCYREQLSAILAHFEQLQAVDTADIPTSARIFSEAAPLRPDEPCPGLSRESLLANAPESEAGQFRVPPVFE